MESYKHEYLYISEELSNKIDAARDRVLSLIGPDSKKPNKEAVLSEINKMDDEIAIHLLNESLKKNTILGEVFYTKRGFFDPNEDSGIFIEVKKSLDERLNSPKAYKSLEKKAHKISERVFSIPAESIIGGFTGKLKQGDPNDYGRICHAIEKYVKSELKKIGLKGKLDHEFFMEIIKNSFDAYHASEDVKKGKPLEIKIVFSNKDDCVLFKYKDNAIGFPNLKKGEQVLYESKKTQEYQRKAWKTKRWGGQMVGLCLIDVNTKENFPSSRMFTKNRKNQGASINFEIPTKKGFFK